MLYKQALSNAMWQKLIDIPALSTSREEHITNAVPGDSSRYFSVITPSQP